MARRKTKNTTGIPRVDGIARDDVWVSYVCVSCKETNVESVGADLLDPIEAYNSAVWVCSNCEFIHSKDTDLPFEHWPDEALPSELICAERFWKAFFRTSTAKKEYYWKQCNVCERVLPEADFARHVDWGALEKQMECKACKAVINAMLNPKRTTEQLRESAMKRRISELLTKSVDEKLDVKALFERFGSKCFKTGQALDINKPKTWQIDHTLPAKYFYPLTVSNATLLSTNANQDKSDKWPSKFYDNKQLIELARITGASLELLAADEPIQNPDIDVNNCVDKFLTVRESSVLSKRIAELKLLLEKHELQSKLSEKNLKLLGLSKE